jgi:hypothetical protein
VGGGLTEERLSSVDPERSSSSFSGKTAATISSVDWRPGCGCVTIASVLSDMVTWRGGDESSSNEFSTDEKLESESTTGGSLALGGGAVADGV